MNRKEFKTKLFSLTQNSLIPIDFARVFTVLSSSAQRLPSLNVEPFFSKLFGIQKESFKQPKDVAQSLRDEAVLKLESNGIFKPDFKLLQLATKNALIRMKLATNQFRPIGIIEAVSTLPHETSSGYPDFHRPKGELRQEVIASMSQILANNQIPYIHTMMVSYVSWRTQERLSGTKYRQFFIFPMIINSFENMFMRPLIYYYQNLNYDFSNAYSFHADFTEMKSIWLGAQEYNYIIGLDYSAFDLNVSQQMIAYAMYTIKSLFRLNWWQSKLFDQIILCHIQAYVITNYQGRSVIVNKKSGVLSGSVFTNFLDTLVNLIMLEYTLLELGINSNHVSIKVKGDDTLLMSNNPQLRLNTVIEVLTKRFGAVIKPESCDTFSPGEPITYLGYTFTDNTKFALSDELLFRKMVISGRFFSEDEMPPEVRIISKAISILSNVTNGFDLFYKYIYPEFSRIYKVTELPKYYYNLEEKGDEKFMEIRDVQEDLRYGWMLK